MQNVREINAAEIHFPNKFINSNANVWKMFEIFLHTAKLIKLILSNEIIN